MPFYRMINLNEISSERLNQVSMEHSNADKIIAEKVIRAFLLLEGLVKQKLPFVFTGGKALMLHFYSNKTLSIIGLVIILTGFCQSGFSQNLNDDPYAKICFKFSKDLNSEIEISELVKYFDDSQKTDSLKFKLSECIDEIKINREKIEYYITKFDRPNLVFYNVNLYNPKEKLTFGDLRIVFKDKKDFLIDDWIYLKETDANDNAEDNKLPPIPPPPLPK